MKTKYTHILHVVAQNAIAQQLSAVSFALCPDVGLDNVSIPLNANGNDAEATHFAFSSPVTQQHIDTLFGAGLGVTPGVKWARTNREGLLEKRWDNENPIPEQYSFDDLLAECGLKFQTIDVA